MLLIEPVMTKSISRLCLVYPFITPDTQTRKLEITVPASLILNTHRPLSDKEVMQNARREKMILMHKFTKFVLVCYILLLFKPILPIISDAIAHTFYEKQHILLVHEVHGRFHIHQELANVSHQSDNEKSNELKYQSEEYLHVTSSLFKSFLYLNCVGTYLTYAYYCPIIPYRDTNYPPPKPMAQNKISGAICYGS
jgi:hypothetical protein